MKLGAFGTQRSRPQKTNAETAKLRLKDVASCNRQEKQREKAALASPGATVLVVPRPLMTWKEQAIEIRHKDLKKKLNKTEVS